MPQEKKIFPLPFAVCKITNSQFTQPRPIKAFNRNFMTLKQIVLLIAIYLLACTQVAAQSSMTDSQVMQFMMKENARGTSRSDLVQKLIEKGVTIEQIRRVREKYEKQQDGSVVNSRDITGSSKVESNSRLRQNNGDSRDDFKGNRQRKSKQDAYSENGLSQQQIKELRRQRKEEYMDEMDYFLPDSLDFIDIEDEEYGFYKEEEPEKEVFGRNIFNNKKLSFEPNMNIATPADYHLGPGDEVYVDVWGASQERFACTVSPDGTIDIETYGPLNVDGLTVAEANQRLQSTLGARYSGSQVQLTVGQTKTITVDIMGEVEAPGSYTISAFSTVFNALYMAGGTNEIGTLRNIKVYRDSKLISTCDIYDYILNGNMKGNVRLNSGDVIIVGPYECLVNLTGKVKRPMYYEMKSKESVGTLIEYAGGFAGDAYEGSVCLVRRAGGEFSVYTIDEFDRHKFQLADGDSVSVDSTLNRYRNMVEVKGAVWRPGLYQMDGNITTIRQLLEAAGGIREDAISSRGILHRRKEDHSLEVKQVDIKGILEHRVADITLRNEDAFYVPSKKEMQEELYLTIDGEINYPGEYEFAENTTIEDFILQAGGLKDAASMVKVDIFRRIRYKNALQSENQIAKSFSFQIAEGFVIEGEPGFVLEPFDEVIVRRSPGYVEQQHVTIEGEIAFEGAYVLTNKAMRLSDLVEAAGGLTNEAYPAGAHLERRLTAEEKIKQESMIRLASSGDSINIQKLELSDIQNVGINLDQALKYPGSDQWDIVLRDQDKLVIPQFNNTVTITGEVMYPNTVAYNDKAKLSDYIEKAGGYGRQAMKRRVFVVNMNGTVNKIHSSKDIQPGCNILVPAKPKRTRMSLGELLSIGTMTATLGTVIATLITN